MVVSLQRWLWRSALVVGLLLAGSALAEEEEVHRAEEILVEDDFVRPAEVFEAGPVEREVLTREDIETMPAQNAAQVIEKLPGIRTQQRIQGEESAVSVEGMPPEYTQILVDGQRYTGEIGGVADLRDVPLENVERIEIIRGAQALRYGSEAAGAVIDIIRSPPPDDGWRANANGGYGKHNNVQGSGTGAWGNELLGGTVMFDHDQIDGFDPPPGLKDGVLVGGNENSRRKSRDVDGTVVYHPLPSLSLRSRVGFREEDDDISFEGVQGTTTKKEDRWIASQRVDWSLGEATRLVGDLTYYRLETQSNTGRQYELDEDQSKLDLALEHFVELGPLENMLTLGLDGRVDRLRLEEGDLPPEIENDDLGGGVTRKSFRKLGIFGIVETELASWFSTEAGVRVQLHNRFDTEFLPQIALLFTPREDLKLRISYGRNARNPSLRDLYQPPVPQLGGAYFLAGNPNLDTEESTSARASLEYSPRPWISMAATGFYNDIDDHIRSTFAGSVPIGTQVIDAPPASDRPGLGLACSATGNFFPECGGEPLEVPLSSSLFVKNNLDSVETYGLEARLELRPHPLGSLQVGYTLLETEVKDSNLVGLKELPNEAKHTIDSTLRLRAPRLDSALTVRARWRGRALVETSGTGLLGFTTQKRSNPTFELDARLTQPITENFSVYVDGFNLTNERVVDSYVIRGRSWFVGVQVRFE